MKMYAESVLFMLVAATAPVLILSASWSYHGEYGPEYWKTLADAECNGTRQSPIDIDTGSVVLSNFEPFELNDYTSRNQYLGLDNNGHGVTVRLADDISRLYKLSGGGLPTTYVATQFHFHWGSVNSRGSEHTLNGRAFPGEVHIVHYAEQYSDLGEALVSGNQYAVAVLGFFFEISPQNNDAFDSFLNYVGDISTWTSPKAALPPGSIPSFSLRSILPFDLSRFYRYNGSLTTPNCYETVIWTVFDKTITISQRQLNILRSVTGNENDANGNPEHVVDNFRPTNPLYGRNVYFNVPSGTDNQDNTDDEQDNSEDCQNQNTPEVVSEEPTAEDRLAAVMTVVVIVLGSVLVVTFIWAVLMTVMFVTLKGKHEELKHSGVKV